MNGNHVNQDYQATNRENPNLNLKENTSDRIDVLAVLLFQAISRKSNQKYEKVGA